MGKGEIARYEQFLLFPQCFQKACFPGASKGVIVREWVNCLPNDHIVDWSKLQAFADDKVNVAENLKLVRVENIVEKVENSGYQHPLLFPEFLQKASFGGGGRGFVKRRDHMGKELNPFPNNPWFSRR